MAKAKSVKKLLAELPAFRGRVLELEAGAPDVGAIADRLGRVAAIKAELETYEKALKAIVIENGEPAVEGKLFRAVLSTFEQERLDSKAIKATMDAKWLKKFTVSAEVTTVRVHARTGALIEAA